jgi:sec-independent protein translocase protein TatC
MPSPVLETAQKRASEEMTGMSFLEHLEELRRRIIYSAIYVVAGFAACWFYHEQIFALMQRPIMQALASHHLDQKLVYLNPTDPFNMYLRPSTFSSGSAASSPR